MMKRCNRERFQTLIPSAFLMFSAAGVAAFSNVDNLYWRNAGYSFFEISIMASVFNIAIAAAELPFSVYFDRVSNKRSLQIGNVARAAAFVLFLVNPGLGGIVAGMALAGVGTAATSGASEALVINNVPESMKSNMLANYSRIFVLNTASSLVAGALGILVFSFLPAGIWILALALFILAAVSIALYREPASDGEPIPWQEYAASVKGVLALRPTFVLVLINAAAIAPFLFWQIKLGVESLWFLLGGFLLMKIFSLCAAPIRSKLGLGRKTLWLVALYNVAVVITFGLIDIQAIAFILFGMHVLGQGLLSIIGYGWFHAEVQDHARSSSLSLISLLDSGLVCVLAPVVGWVATTAGLGAAICLSGVAYAAICGMGLTRNTRGTA